MKKRMISALAAAALLLSLTACGTEDTAESTDSSAAVQPHTTYTGTVSASSADAITITTDTGDLAIALTDSTTFSRDFGMGGQQSADMGQAPADMGGGMEEHPADMDSGEVPEKPDSQSEGQMGEAPEKPDGGNGQTGSAPELPEGQGGGQAMDPMGGSDQTLTVSDIALGDSVTVVTGEDGSALSVTISGGEMTMEKPDGMGQGGNMGGPGGGSSGVDSYDAATEFTADASQSGKEYTSTAADENAIHVYEGASVTLEDAAITRNSADSTGGDNSSFYGIGAAALVTDGTLTIADSTIDTDAAGGAGVFAYGDGTAYVWDTAITTARDTAGGIHVAGGGTLYAWDLTVETEGESSAAIRSDRGSGTMVVDGGSYISNGVGSPAVYSAADISVHNADLTATGSEAICIEGLNSIRLFDCDLSGDMEDLRQNDCTWNVILYQSMSGDSEVGNSTFEMVGGSLTAGNGGMFYTTNTESTFILSGVDSTYAEDSEFFLKCTGNANQRGWGTSGRNGADCHFTALSQAMAGDVIWDTISQLDFYVLEGSTFTGAVVNDETNAGAGGDGYAALYLDETSTWIVTGDSRLTALHRAGTIVDADGQIVTITGADGTVYVQGSSPYTITVDSYDSEVDTSAASAADTWETFAVSKPA